MLFLDITLILHQLIILHQVELLPNDEYVIFWKFNKEDITFEVHAQTTGWVGFGLSPNGGMAGSDMVIGWVPSDGGETVLTVTKLNFLGHSDPFLYSSLCKFLRRSCSIQELPLKFISSISLETNLFDGKRKP